MSAHAVLFYLLAAFILVSTGLAITRRNIVHAIVLLIFSFVGSAMLFFLLGAPFLAALEVIIYAGAIMILFLFVIMMLKVGVFEHTSLSFRRWMPSIVIGLLFLTLSSMVVFRYPGGGEFLKPGMTAPKEFGRFVYERYWLAVEIISALLLLGLLAAVQLGQGKSKDTGSSETPTEERP